MIKSSISISKCYDDEYKDKVFTDFLDRVENGDFLSRSAQEFDPAWIYIALSNNKPKAANMLLDFFQIPKDNMTLKERLAYFQLMNGFNEWS